MSKPVLGLLAGLAVVSAAPMLLARRGGRNVAPDVAALQRLLAHLRALRWQYHTTHWQSKGPNFYGDHLLFERLYAGEGGGPDLDAEIDGLGERMTRFFGAETVDDSAILPLTTAILAVAGSEREPIRRAMALETATHEAIDHAYEALAASGHKTLGLDDFLMALADERDTAAYLLGQRLDAPPRFVAAAQSGQARGSGNKPSGAALLRGWPKPLIRHVQDERKRLDARMTGPFQVLDVALDGSVRKVMAFIDDWLRERGGEPSAAWIRKWESGLVDREVHAYLSSIRPFGSRSACGCGSKNKAGSRGSSNCTCGSIR